MWHRCCCRNRAWPPTVRSRCGRVRPEFWIRSGHSTPTDRPLGSDLPASRGHEQVEDQTAEEPDPRLAAEDQGGAAGDVPGPQRPAPGPAGACRPTEGEDAEVGYGRELPERGPRGGPRRRVQRSASREGPLAVSGSSEPIMSTSADWSKRPRTPRTSLAAMASEICRKSAVPLLSGACMPGMSQASLSAQPLRNRGSKCELRRLWGSRLVIRRFDQSGRNQPPQPRAFRPPVPECFQGEAVPAGRGR